MAKLTEAQKRKNFERTVGSSENDMGPLKDDIKNNVDAIMARELKKPAVQARAKFLGDDMANYNLKKMLAPKDKRNMLPGTANEADYTSNQLNLMPEYKKGGAIKAKKYAKGGSVSSASKRADGCATKGKTKGRII
jgi:hypothetical protein